eukprot:CAMPEP_0119200614 /NCGR_PEP_ID=MMETSP1316-20130426/26629_1 /TAXON_ID=41880 /ORGANISM="Pycnococcus provasolii, Strain RCC2336" /LENGTH=33 /DNA_ID= /DNA_START= /DNA_END= /DNA_ORIENTATION=
MTADVEKTVDGRARAFVVAILSISMEYAAVERG